MKTLIIIPAYNEAENIERVVDNLIENYSQYDYVIVNDGSKDNTVDICRRKKYNLLNLPINLGLAGAFQAGMKYAHYNDYDYALQFDGDGQHNPEYINNMLNVITSTNIDIVIGSRFKESKKPFSMRMLGNRLIQSAIFITTRKKINDPTSGMRMFDRRMINEFASNINYGPEPDTVSYLIRNGALVEEVQVEMSERIAGESYLNFVKSILYMIRMCTSIVFIQFFRKRIKK